MGILKKDASAKSAQGAVTIVAEGNKFSGEMSIVGKLHIDGIFEGTISSIDTISVGKRGEVHGTIRAHQINVCGLLQGEIHCDEINIEDGGRVRGTVYTDQLIVQRNGCFIGDRHLKEEVATELANDASEPSTELTQALEALPDKITLVSDKTGSE